MEGASPSRVRAAHREMHQRASRVAASSCAIARHAHSPSVPDEYLLELMTRSAFIHARTATLLLIRRT